MSSDAEDLVAFLHEKNKPEVCRHLSLRFQQRSMLGTGMRLQQSVPAAAAVTCPTSVAGSSLQPIHELDRFSALHCKGLEQMADVRASINSAGPVLSCVTAVAACKHPLALVG